MACLLHKIIQENPFLEQKPADKKLLLEGIPMRVLVMSTLFSCGLLFVGCGSANSTDASADSTSTDVSTEDKNEPSKIEEAVFQFPGALAISISEEVKSTDLGETNLFSVDSSGKLAPASNVPVTDIIPSSVGVLVITQGSATGLAGTTEYYFVDKEGSSKKVEISSDQSFVASTAAGDYIFTNGSSIYLLRAATSVLEKVNSSLSNPSVKYVSGNFLVMETNDTAQILDTVSLSRYNIARCNGPRIGALSGSKAFVEDCSNDKIIDMTTGTRSALAGSLVFQPNHEQVEVSDGIVFLAQGCNPAASLAYDLCHFDANGTRTTLTTTGFSVGSASIKGSYKNTSLFSQGTTLVVKELSQISLVKRGTDSKTAILSGYNVISVSLKDGVIFYSAEDSQGNPLIGKYDSNAMANTTLESGTKYSKVVAIQY